MDARNASGQPSKEANVVQQTATTSLMRSLNRSSVLDLIRREAPIARGEIARRLNMGLPTVARIIEELIAEGLVGLQGDSESTGSRQRPLLEFNGDAYAVIGVDLGGLEMQGDLATLSGTVHNTVRIAFDGHDGERHLEQLYQLVGNLLNAARAASQCVRGIGIGAPGITRSPEGTVAWAPSLNWRNLHLQAILAERFRLPVFVENDVRLATLGELSFGAGRGVRNLVYVAGGTGLGAGIVVDGVLYRGGANQSAGEIGYLPPAPEYLGRHYDQFGALESLTSATGIAARARRLLVENGDPAPNSTLRADDVFAAARHGETWARQVVAETVDHLSLAIASIVTLLDPEVVILGGDLSSAADLLIGPIIQRLEGVLPFPPVSCAFSPYVACCRIGRDLVCVGGNYRALRNQPVTVRAPLRNGNRSLPSSAAPGLAARLYTQTHVRRPKEVLNGCEEDQSARSPAGDRHNGGRCRSGSLCCAANGRTGRPSRAGSGRCSCGDCGTARGSDRGTVAPGRRKLGGPRRHQVLDR